MQQHMMQNKVQKPFHVISPTKSNAQLKQMKAFEGHDRHGTLALEQEKSPKFSIPKCGANKPEDVSLAIQFEFSTFDRGLMATNLLTATETSEPWSAI